VARDHFDPPVLPRLGPAIQRRSSVHADTVDEVFDVLARNGVDVASASHVRYLVNVRYLVKIRPLGDPLELQTPRVVEEIHKVVPRKGPITFHVYRSNGITAGRARLRRKAPAPGCGWPAEGEPVAKKTAARRYPWTTDGDSSMWPPSRALTIT
jgi:hypothetical protein